MSTQTDKKKKIKLSQRIKDVTKDLEHAIEEKVAEEQLMNTADDSLFIVDKVGSKRARRRVEEELKPKEEKRFISKTELKLIRRINENKKNEQNKEVKNESDSLTDLWSVDYSVREKVPEPKGILIRKAENKEIITKEELKTPSTNTINKRQEEILKLKKDEEVVKSSFVDALLPGKEKKRLTRNLKLPLPGQSYNPSFVDHQNVLAEAYALELQEEEKIKEIKEIEDIIHKQEEKNKTQIVELLNTKDLSDLLLNQYSESEEESDSENESDEQKINKKMKEKYTKSQRNRQKNNRNSEYQLELMRNEKKFNKQFDSIDKLLKEINNEDKDSAKNQEIRKLNYIEKVQQIESNSLTLKTAASIPLSDELNGSLRQLKPKGNNLIENKLRMIDNGDNFDKFQRKKKKTDKPHGAKKVKFYAKYKYE